jgi:hypothetical protein
MDTDHEGHPAHDPSGTPSAPASGLPSGWVALERNYWFTDLARNLYWLIIWLPLLGNVAQLFVPDEAAAYKVVVWAGVSTVGLIATLLWFRFRPVPRANFDTSEIRIGQRTMSMGDIRWARLSVAESTTSRSITLQFGPGTLHIGAEQGSPWRPTYVVRRASGQTPPAERAQLVAEVLRRSNIELPQTPDDPTGKFTWFNFPGSITREQAIEVVLHPPAYGDPLPIPSSHMRDAPRRGKTRKSGRGSKS